MRTPPKVLHASFHKGCILDFEDVAEELGIDLTSWFVFSSPVVDFDGVTDDLNVYNLCVERARRVWERHKHYFRGFDVVVTSDTAPLSRIFLEGGWGRPLIIWVCNRFDYSHRDRMDCEFPDPDYYGLIRKAAASDLVTILPYTEYEHDYALAKGIDIGKRIIKPTGGKERNKSAGFRSSIPPETRKAETILLHPGWLNEDQVRHLLSRCRDQGITTFCGRYNGPEDIEDFKGVLYFPNQASNFYLFESFQHGIVNYVPSETFLARERMSNPLTPQVAWCRPEQSEWYRRETRGCLVYFDSWPDLKEKIDSIDRASLSVRIRGFGRRHRADMIGRWREVFDELGIGGRRSSLWKQKGKVRGA
jgi:hypothetical protein